MKTASTRLGCLLIAMAFGSGASANPTAREAAAQSFWSGFRDAVQKKDKVAILKFANLPFIIRWGNADSNDPAVKLDQKEFSGAIDRILAIRTSDSDSSSPSMSKVIEGKTSVATDEASSGEFIVENFEFRKVKGAWRWTTAFTTDPTFYPKADSSEVPRESPLRKILIDTTAKAMGLRRPLTVKYLKADGHVAYIEVQEPGKSGRLARAFLQREPDDAEGTTIYLVKESSIVPKTGDDREWRDKLADLKKSGVPASLFPTGTPRQEGDRHALR